MFVLRAAHLSQCVSSQWKRLIHETPVLAQLEKYSQKKRTRQARRSQLRILFCNVSVSAWFNSKTLVFHKAFCGIYEEANISGWSTAHILHSVTFRLRK